MVNEEAEVKKSRGRPRLEDKEYVAFVANRADAFEMGGDAQKWFSTMAEACNFFGCSRKTIMRVSRDRHVIRGRQKLDWLLFTEDDTVPYIQKQLGRNI